MAPTSRTRSGRAIPAPRDDKSEQDMLAEDAASSADAFELFVDPLQGNPLSFYVHDDVQDKQEVLKLIRIHGGGASSSYTNATYILVDPTTEAGHNLYILFHNNKKGKTILDSRWVKECVKAKAILAFRDNWAGCRVTGQERDDFLKQQETNAAAHPIPPLDTAAPVQVNLDEDMNAMQSEQPVARGETPTPSRPVDDQPQASSSQGTQADPNRPSQPIYFPSHPLIYGFPPPPRPGHSMPTPIPWPYMAAPPFPMMFAPPPPHPPGQTSSENQDAQPTMGYPPFPHQQAQDYSQAWIEYYAQMDPYAYTKPVEEHHPPYQFLAPAPEGPEFRGRRARIRPRNSSNAKIAVKAVAPPARSPTPPTRVVKSTYGGNLFTEEDVTYLKRYIEYCQEQGLLLSLREICERLAIRAPHHTFFSWRRYCNKHHIRLGAYAMGDRPEDGDADGDEQDSNPNGEGTSNQASSKAARSGSPVPPSILYKSTTGKGVAFTQEDVQYMMDYMKYRKEQTSEPLDMVEFWNDLAERAPHHSRASWMKYWRRHRHELEQDGDQPVATLPAPVKKSRYTQEDDILLAKHFAELESAPDRAERKTSDAMFQEFATRHPHHPWKGWQEHHRLHKTQIDHLVKQLKEGKEL